MAGGKAAPASAEGRGAPEVGGNDGGGRQLADESAPLPDSPGPAFVCPCPGGGSVGGYQRVVWMLPFPEKPSVFHQFFWVNV